MAFIDEDIASVLEAPCNQIKPVEPFPFRSNRISRSILFRHYLILFPFYTEYKKCQHLYLFDLSTHKWSALHSINPPEILENTDNYQIIPDYVEGGFILIGCYKTFEAGQTRNLFSQSQVATLNKSLYWIDVGVKDGQLRVKWQKCEGADNLPYLEKFSANLRKDSIYLFGGCDENGQLTNTLCKFKNKKNVLKEIELFNKQPGGFLPCTRMGHTSRSRGVYFEIFGGEDKNSFPLNDLWVFDVAFDGRQVSCAKYNRKQTNRCSKLGTPCAEFHENDKTRFVYIGKSTTQTLPPFKNYLCVDELLHLTEEVLTWSPKEPLPFDGIPHTLELYQGQIILGFESSIYSIPFKPEISPTPDFENLAEEPGDDVMVVRKTRPKNFKGHMRQYFEERPFPDVSFRVQGEEVSAHRGILSVRCPFFSELFSAESGEAQNKPIEITDLSPAGFNTLLEWLYCNEIFDLKDNVAAELLKVMNKYSLPKLKIEAEKNLMKNLTIENSLERAKIAVESSARDLETAVVKFIASKIKNKEELKNYPSSIIERVENIQGSGRNLDLFHKNKSGGDVSEMK